MTNEFNDSLTYDDMTMTQSPLTVTRKEVPLEKVQKNEQMENRRY